MTIAGEHLPERSTTRSVPPSFDEAYEAHYVKLVRVLRLDGLSLGDSEDIAQEAFARALARWAVVSKGSNPAGYVYTTAFRLRRRRRVRPNQAHAAQATGMDPLEGVLARLDVEQLLAKLSATQRRCLTMYYLGDLPTDEIATVLKISPSTVRVHIHRARDRLIGEVG